MNMKKFAVAALLGLGIALAGATAADAVSYPPATTGTFTEVATAGGSTAFAIDGLDPNQPASGTISSNGPLPTIGVLSATRALDFGTTDASGVAHFSLVFPKNATGTYNLSLTTPGGASASGSITIKGTPAETGVLPTTGSEISRAAIWGGGVVVLLGIAGIIAAVIRRRATSSAS